MNYQETLDYLFTQLPMFQRIGAAAYKADLNNTIAICKLLGNPETKFKSVHIAGTNGKGSTSHYIAAILQEAGYKTGLYTSPHLKDFRERIKINGEPIPQETVIDFVSKYKTDFEEIKPSFFEMTVGLAFDYFASQKVDIAIIETGMGGRLDSTNVIQPLLSVITNISLDHMAFLGKTRELIAAEKAGIIKKNVPVIIGESQKETEIIFTEKAAEMNAIILFADKKYTAKHIHFENHGKTLLCMDIAAGNEVVFKTVESELLGTYQQKNIPAVIAAMDILKNLSFDITTTHIRNGIKNVMTLTGLLGRWQILQEKPLVVADIAHNIAGITEIVRQIKETPHHQLHIILGVVNDKDVSGILEILPKTANYYFCNANIPRALNARELGNKAEEFGLTGNVFPAVKDALETAKVRAKKGDLVFVGGSAFVVAEALE